MNNKTILLVDDEVEFATTLAQRLELRGFTPLVAADGESALALLAQHTVDLVFLDIMLPGLSGQEVLKCIRAQHASLPVVMLTGNTGSQNGSEWLAMGANSCLGKPLDFQQLLETITRLSAGESHA